MFALVGATALAGWLGTSSLVAARPVSSAATCTVELFFNLRASKGQIDAVAARLRRDRSIRSIRVLTREQALQELRKKFPDLLKSLPSNPLPARIELNLVPGTGQAQTVARYKALRLSGVANVARVESPPGSFACLR